MIRLRYSMVSMLVLVLVSAAPLAAEGACNARLQPAVEAIPQKAPLTPEKQTALEWLDTHHWQGADIAKYIWHHPELGLGERKSSAILQDYLTQAGFQLETGVAGMETAWVASWGQGKPVIGIHAEFDALPGLSQELGSTVRKPVVEGGFGHGCGHNLFGAYSAMAGIAVKEAMEAHGIQGTIKVFGTPAEETLVGKAFFVKHGIYDDTDMVISWHPGGGNRVAYRSSLAMDNFKIRFHGTASHAAAAPWAGRSALDAVELMNIGMNYMREHIEPSSRIMYVIPGGGEAPNTVPPFAEVWYYVRAPRYEKVAEIMEWTLDVARGAAIMTQTEMEYAPIAGVWEFLPNQVLARVGDANVRLIGAPPFTEEDQKTGEGFSRTLDVTEGPFYSTRTSHPNVDEPFEWAVGGGSIDEANTSWVVPMVRFTTATRAAGTPGHSWQQVAQNALEPAFKGSLTAAKYMAATALDMYANPQLIDAAWEELREMNALHGPFFDPVADIDVPSYRLMHGFAEDAVTMQWEVLPFPYPAWLENGSGFRAGDGGRVKDR